MEESNEILNKTGKKLEETMQQVRKTTIKASKKVQSSYDARLGALIVGIILSVISGLLVLTFIGGFIFVFVVTTLGYDLDLSIHDYQHPFRNYNVMNIMIVTALITVGLIFSLLEFSFAVVLADGASKRKIGHLKAYLIYGNVKIVVAFILSIALYITIWDNFPGNMTLFACGLNVVVTMMVYLAYKNVKSSIQDYSKFDNEVGEQE